MPDARIINPTELNNSKPPLIPMEAKGQLFLHSAGKVGFSVSRANTSASLCNQLDAIKMPAVCSSYAMRNTNTRDTVGLTFSAKQGKADSPCGCIACVRYAFMPER
jgi:hypothetical protein